MPKMNWRSADTAPRDGTSFVAMRTGYTLGGWSRPIDLTVDLMMLRREGARRDPFAGGYVSGGYWQDPRHQHSVADFGGMHWMPTDEYAAAVRAAPLWSSISKNYGAGPVVFVRPMEPKPTTCTAIKPITCATIAWCTGSRPEDGWQTVNTKPGAMLPIAYLNASDTYEYQQAFRSFYLSEFMPREVFELMREREQNQHRYRLDEIARWQGLVPERRDGAIHRVEFRATVKI